MGGQVSARSRRYRLPNTTFTDAHVRFAMPIIVQAPTNCLWHRTQTRPPAVALVAAGPDRRAAGRALRLAPVRLCLSLKGSA